MTTPLETAKARCDLIRVADHFGHSLKPGKCHKSPFREDKKSSFSVYNTSGGPRWKDHATGEGGAQIDYIMKAMGCDTSAAIELLMNMAGVDPKSGEWKPPTAHEARKRRDAARRAAHEDWQKKLKNPGKRYQDVFYPTWSDEVAARFAQGLGPDASVAAGLNEARGWPEGWAETLLADRLISYPFLRWARQGAKHAQRGWAWRVDKPCVAFDGRHDVQFLEPVGYHQRYSTPSVKKGWIYVPSKINNPGGRPLTPFEQHLDELDVSIPALPLALGDVEAPERVIILEGEWDAATLWLAARDPSLCVFGIRGATGTDVFLALYGGWLKRHKPKVLLIPDVDDAGTAWLPAMRYDGKRQKPCFKAQLEAMKLSVSVQRLDRCHGKDFNDWFKSMTPSEAEMRRWIEEGLA